MVLDNPQYIRYLLGLIYAQGSIILSGMHMVYYFIS